MTNIMMCLFSLAKLRLIRRVSAQRQEEVQHSPRCEVKRNVVYNTDARAIHVPDRLYEQNVEVIAALQSSDNTRASLDVDARTPPKAPQATSGGGTSAEIRPQELLAIRSRSRLASSLIWRINRRCHKRPPLPKHYASVSVSEKKKITGGESG